MNLDHQHLKFKGDRIILHVLFWTGYIFFVYLQYTMFNKSVNTKASLVSLTLTALVDISASYLTVYYLLPKFLFKRKYWQFALLFLLSAALFIISQRALLYYIIYPAYFPGFEEKMGRFWHINPFYSFINIYTVVGFFATIKLLKYLYRNQQIKTELENKNRASELALLRTQLNPHFLFNTLNNIDSLILTRPQKASDAIIKLSDIMRFMLYDTSTDKVPLDKEVSYLRSYISLQQIRLKDPDFVHVHIEGNCLEKSIAPMLFIPFVENAFKHGLKNVTAPGIEIKLNIQKDAIDFEVINRVDASVELNKDLTRGIGLSNTKRRLELLYAGKHQLSMKTENGYYITRLYIKL